MRLLSRSRGEHACRLLALLSLVLLTSCYAAQERRLAHQMIKAGDLAGAHRLLANLVAEGETQDRKALASVCRQIAAKHYERAVEWRQRGHDLEAFRELSHALQFDPQHAPAKQLAVRIGDEAERLRQWKDEYRSAVDDGEAERALDLLAEAERDRLKQRFYGIVPQLVEDAWRGYDERFEGARRGRLILDMQQELLAAEQFLAQHQSRTLVTDHPFAEDLKRWRAALRVQEHVEFLVTRAEKAHARGDSVLAYQEIRQAQLLDPECPWLRDRHQHFLDKAVEAWLAQLREATTEKEWQRALAIWRRLDSLGLSPDEEWPLPPLEQLRVEELLTAAETLEADGRSACALLALLQAVQIRTEADPTVQAKIARLRSELRARPLVAVGNADLTPENAIAPIVVQKGTPDYEERRLPRLKQRGDVQLPERLEERSNPAYEAERSRWLALRNEFEDAERELAAAAPLERDFLAARCEHIASSLARAETRLEQIRPTEWRLAWKSSTWQTQTWELIAELEIPLQIHFAGEGWREKNVMAQLRVLDQTRAADPTRSVPDDPNDLPATDDVRQQLDHECDERFAKLLEELRRQARELLLRRAEAQLAGGDEIAATEDLVWVILSSPTVHDPVRDRAALLLEDQECARAAVDAL